ncbi:ABC transporter permease, partial [Blautia pseudococcoides]|nr:ABC transporter permease [Blautia pseudococcoides]
NLGILYYTERFREFATLKVLGFKSKRIRSLMVSQNIWLTLIGAILGIPIGFLVLSYMTNTLGDNLDMTPKVFGSSILICFTGTILVSLLVNLLLANNIKKIDMVSALKSIE